MMQVKLGDKEVYRYKFDYQKTLSEIEELEKLADEQTTTKEVLQKAGEIIQAGSQLLTGILIGAGVSLFGEPGDINKMLGTFKQARDNNKLKDAKKELRELVEKGEKFGQEEIETNKENK